MSGGKVQIFALLGQLFTFKFVTAEPYTDPMWPKMWYLNRDGRLFSKDRMGGGKKARMKHRKARAGKYNGYGSGWQVGNVVTTY